MMEKVIKIHMKKLPEGYFLATSDDIQGLVAQGRTVTETLEIARDIAKKLLEAQAELTGGDDLPEIEEQFDIPLVVGL
jgi:predicted RNase H-like HicB family nuclease